MLSQNEVLRRFRKRASAEEIREFEQAVASTEPDADIRALELVLFRLNDNELFELGITQVEQPDGWGVAWSDDSLETYQVITRTLDQHEISPFGSCGRGRCGWYVPREQFFRARQALLAAPDVQARKITVTELELKLR